MGEPEFLNGFREALRPGAYLRIIREGEVDPGDEVELLSRPDHGVTIGQVFSIYRTRPAEAAVLLRAPQLSPKWREWARSEVPGDSAPATPG